MRPEVRGKRRRLEGDDAVLPPLKLPLGPPRWVRYDSIVFFSMTHQGLGEFEQMVLLAIVHLRDDAYAIPIVDEIERRTGRSVARAAVYITLRRLEEKGFVSSWMGEPIAERGGKARRYVKLEAAGMKALREARSATEKMWRGLDPASLRAR
jgi:DNA-binding PadR family transcriptional regulator